MPDSDSQPTQTQEAFFEFEPSDLIEYGAVSDLTRNNVSGALDGAAYS